MRIDRHDWKVDWNDDMEKKGFVVSHDIFISFDIEALPMKQLKELDKKAGAYV